MSLSASSLLNRIAVISYHTCPLAQLGGKKAGGMNVYVRDYARAMAATGVQVDVFTRLQDNCDGRIDHELAPNCRVIHLPAGPVTPLSPAEMADHVDEFARSVLDFVSQEEQSYDLIHAHYWLSGLIGEQLRMAWDAPLIQMFHTLGHMKNRIAQSPDELAPQSRLDGEAHLARVADKLIAATPAECAHLRDLYGADGRKIATISPGVDLGKFHPMHQANAKTFIGIPQTRKNLLYAGRIEPLKGIDTLLLALAQLQAYEPRTLDNVCVTIIGGDPWAATLDEEMQRLQQMSDELGVHDLITFAGSRDQTILPYYYAAAEMVVMPSHYESFGLVALESMAMGTPVIASEVGGLAYLVRDGYNGYLVPAREPQALAKPIASLLSNSELRDRLGQNAHDYAQGFDWPRIVDRLTRLFKQTVAEFRGVSLHRNV